jgi:hypothetical protein
MTRRICCVCGIQYGTKDDGRDEVVDSHGYCERHFDEVMLQIKNEFAELPADGARSV